MTKSLASLAAVLLIGGCSGGGAGNPCVPGQSIACIGVGNCAGAQTCSADGARYDPCVCGSQVTDAGSADDGGQPDAGFCVASPPTVGGVFHTTEADVAFASVTSTVQHKIDVDPQEDGCIVRLVLDLRASGASAAGCTLRLEFGTVNAAWGGLTKAVFQAESFCPGFPDVKEGIYTSVPGYGPWWYVGPTRVTPALATDVCVSGKFAFPDKAFLLKRSDGVAMAVNLKDLTVTGDFHSIGSPEVTCLNTGPCTGSYHDDGSGWCVGVGCALGYQDGGGGQCVLSGSCSAGYRNGGAGVCVTNGSCSIGFHEGGAGICVTTRTCSPGFHDGGAGVCVATGACSSGYQDGGAGVCVATGTCSATFHDGGTGACIASGTCASGFWLEGTGRCVLWTLTGPMTATRLGHTATLLPNGKVLVASGNNSLGITSVVELYEPTPNTWTVVRSMAVGRWNHTATLLPNGKVLVAGGYRSSGPTPTAELYDPAFNTWTSAGVMSAARYNHTATLLANGNVLVMGGSDGSSSLGGGVLASADLYNAAGNAWTSAAPMGQARYDHTATMLGNGKVLVTGGSGVSGVMASAELYDATRNTWTDTGAMSTGRYSHAATLLATGEVLVMGGSTTVLTSERYSSTSGTWSVGAAMAVRRSEHSATTLPSGKVLVVGGAGRAAELYDPNSNTWTSAGMMLNGRNGPTATLLLGGKVLVAGGQSSAFLPAELYVGN